MNIGYFNRQHRNSLVKLYTRLLILTVPFLPLIVIYYVFDPDMVLGKYKRFDQSDIVLNEGYIGWQNYLNNRDSIPFNSFIMGNSCTMAFRTDEWEKYLSDNSRAVRFFENAESMAGVCQKVQALEEENAQLDNLLIVLDAYSFAATRPSQDTRRIFSWKAAGISHTQFLFRNLQSFLMPSKCLSYLRYRITGKYTADMKSVIIPDGPIREPFTNNFLNPREREIVEDGEIYWNNHYEEFHKKSRNPGEIARKTIFNSQISMLEGLKAICSRHSTNVTLIISPEYFQKKIHPEDLQKLQDIFGKESVFDFSGVNSYTEDYHNYYEPGHYRPYLGAKLLKDVYSKVVQQKTERLETNKKS